MLLLGAALLIRWPSADAVSERAILLSSFFVALATVPLAFLAVLLRTRLHPAAVADLVVELGCCRRPRRFATRCEHSRRRFARAGVLAAEDARYVDADGNTLDPEHESGRAVTVLEHDGRRLAALIHDRSLLDDRELVEAVGAAASLALENARLQAELRPAAEVRASRARIVEAGDAERRRLERDLHDGAQRLHSGFGSRCNSSTFRVGDERAVEGLLAEADTEVADALEELRALAQASTRRS